MKHVIIIGSGLGGLSTGAMLSRNGFKVTVLEQARQIGGCLQCFEREGVRFETGMHVVGSLGENEILSNYLDMFGVRDKLKFSRLDDDAYDIVSLQGKQYSFAVGHERMTENMLRHFPDQGDNLRKYWRLVDSVATAAPFYSSLSSDGNPSAARAEEGDMFRTSLNDVIDGCVTNPLLRDVLVGNIPLYAAVKDRTPFSVHAFVADFYNKGAYRIVGGSDNLAKAFSDIIIGRGGQVLTDCRVCRFVCRSGVIESVVDSAGNKYEGDIFISDIHPANLVSLFGEEALRSSYVDRIMALPNTTSVFSLFLRFKEGTVPYLNSNFFCYRDGVTPWTLGSHSREMWPDGFLYMHHCHADRASYARSGVMLSYMPFEWLSQWDGTRQGRRGADYESFKRHCAERMLDALDENFPGIKSCVDSYYTSTPLTYRDYTLTPKGSMYGILHDVGNGVAGRVSWRTKLPNLMLVGQNINSHGILGVLIGSMQVCRQLGCDINQLSTLCRRLRTPLNQLAEVSSSQLSTVNCQLSTSDVAIVGGGLGGLLTGAILAKNGRRVTIVEKNRRVGGGLQMFRRGAVEFPTGMHVFGGFTENGVMRHICRYLGIEDSIGVVDTDPDSFDEIVMPDGATRYYLPRGRENYVRYLSSLFPDEAEGIKAYVDALYDLERAEMSLWNPSLANEVATSNVQFLWPADEFIAYYIKDQKLRDLLSYLAPLYSGISGETPAYEHAMINVLHIEGSSMFVDGSQRMADALAKVITDYGGSILTGNEVTSIEVIDHHAVALYTSKGLKVEAMHYISAIDPRQLMSLVSPGAFPTSFRERINDAPYGYSAFKLFLTLNPGTLIKPQAINGSAHVPVGNNSNQAIKQSFGHPCYYYNAVEGRGAWNAADVSFEEWPLCAMAITSPHSSNQAINGSAHVPVGYSSTQTITVVAPIAYEWFEKWSDSRTGRRPDDYYKFKKELEQKLLTVLKRSIPQLEDGIESVFSSTPLTIRDYNGIYKGSMYGFHKNCNHIMYTKLSVNTKVRNLFLTGQSVNLHGMCGVAITSVMTAEALLGQGAVMRNI